MSILDKVDRCDRYIGGQGVRLSDDEWIEMLDQLIERLKERREAAKAGL